MASSKDHIQAFPGMWSKVEIEGMMIKPFVKTSEGFELAAQKAL
jgi:hypothetical protein